MNIALRYAARSDVGLVRSNNQDSGYAGPNLIAVADGMGGHAGGDVASSLAIAAIAPLDATEHTPDDALTDLEAAIDRARQDLVDATEVDPQLAGMGTTVTAILRTGSTLVMAHLGDSRAYLLHDGELAQVTTDHTFVQHLVDTGRITADEAETHPQRNVVMRVLGDFDIDLTPDMSVREAKAGDRWMLCSDGLSGFVDPGTIAQTMTDTPDVAECAERLLQLALYAGSTDNVTVVVADVVDLDDQDEAAPSAEAETALPVEIVGSAASPEDLPESVRTTADRAPARTAGEGAADPEDPSSDGPEAHGTDGADDDDPSDDDVRPGRTSRRWVTVVALVLLVVGLGVAVWAAYGWTQQQYYVGISDGQVAVFRGIPESAGPVTLSTPVELTGSRVEDLPGYVVDRLESTIPADSRADAIERADRLIADAAEESEQTDDPSQPTTDAPADEPTTEPTDEPSGTVTSDASTEDS